MALIVTGTKGMVSVAAAYLVAVSFGMSRYLRPDSEQTGTQPNPIEGMDDIPVFKTTMTPAVQYEAKIHFYKDRNSRVSQFMNTPLVESVQFNHINGADPLIELYTQIKANGIEGWEFEVIKDEL